MKRFTTSAWLLAASLAFGCNGGGIGAGDEMDFTTIDNGNEAIGALVQHAAAQDEAYATLLGMFSRSFTVPLFDDTVELDGGSYDDLVAAQQLIVDTHDAYLRAIEYIDSSKPQAITGALELRDAKSGLVKYGLIKSVKNFFWDWAYGNQKRSRDRILTVSEGTSAETKQEMFETAKEKFGDKVGTTPDEMFTKLRNGELDRQAPQLHSNFATAVTDYGVECVEKKLTPTRVAAEEGAEGVKKGVDVVVDSSVAIVNAKFPGFAGGFKKGQAAVKKINQLADKPVEALTAEVKVRAEKWLVGKLGDTLGAPAAGMAVTVAKTIGTYLTEKVRVEQTPTTAPSGSCKVEGSFGSSGSSTKAADVQGIVMTGGPSGASAKDVVVNLGDPSKGNDPVIATCGAYTVDVVGQDTTQSEDLTISEGTDTVVAIDLGNGNPQTQDVVEPEGTEVDDVAVRDDTTSVEALEEADDTSATSGTWTDPATGLVWQKVITQGWGVTWAAADTYCTSNAAGLPGVGWRVPTISELRSIIRGCAGTVTGGACGVTDECLSATDCFSYGACAGVPGSGVPLCALNGGPADGKYWDPNLGTAVGWDSSWSSSLCADNPGRAWEVLFSDGTVDTNDLTSERTVRCVRRP